MSVGVQVKVEVHIEDTVTSDLGQEEENDPKKGVGEETDQGTGTEVGQEVEKAVRAIESDTETEVTIVGQVTDTAAVDPTKIAVEVIEMGVKRAGQREVVGGIHDLTVEAEAGNTQRRKIDTSQDHGQDPGLLKSQSDVVDHTREARRYLFRKSRGVGRGRHRRQVKVLIMSAVVRLSQGKFFPPKLNVFSFRSSSSRHLSIGALLMLWEKKKKNAEKAMRNVWRKVGVELVLFLHLH